MFVRLVGAVVSTAVCEMDLLLSSHGDDDDVVESGLFPTAFSATTAGVIGENGGDNNSCDSCGVAEARRCPAAFPAFTADVIGDCGGLWGDGDCCGDRGDDASGRCSGVIGLSSLSPDILMTSEKIDSSGVVAVARGGVSGRCTVKVRTIM